METTNTKIQFRVLILVCGWTFYACAAGQPTTQQGAARPAVKADHTSGLTISESGRVSPDPKSQLTARAHEVWTARVDKDWPTLYQLQPPSTREAKTEEQFVAMNTKDGLFRFDKYRIHDVLVDADYGWVDVERVCVLSKFPDFPPQTTRTWERWYKFDSQWYCSTDDEMDYLPNSPKERDVGEEPILQKRFNELCELRVSSNFEKAYDFVPPVSRERMSLQTYIEGETLMRVLSCDLRWAEVIGDQGRVRVEYLLQSGDPNMSKLPPSRKTVIEHWRKIDGLWYRISMVSRGCGK
jgi:hypothetical protein